MTASFQDARSFVLQLRHRSVATTPPTPPVVHTRESRPVLVVGAVFGEEALTPLSRSREEAAPPLSPAHLPVPFPQSRDWRVFRPVRSLHLACIYCNCAKWSPRYPVPASDVSPPTHGLCGAARLGGRIPFRFWKSLHRCTRNCSGERVVQGRNSHSRSGNPPQIQLTSTNSLSRGAENTLQLRRSVQRRTQYDQSSEPQKLLLSKQISLFFNINL